MLAFYRNPGELDWKIMKFFGKSSKFLIVRIIFTSMKCRYSWKYPPPFVLYERDSAKSIGNRCECEPMDITLELDVPLTSKNAHLK